MAEQGSRRKGVDYPGDRARELLTEADRPMVLDPAMRAQLALAYATLEVADALWLLTTLVQGKLTTTDTDDDTGYTS